MADSASENEEETSKKGEKRTQDGYEEDSGSSTDAQSVASDESFDEDMVSFFAFVKSRNALSGRLFSGTCKWY